MKIDIKNIKIGERLRKEMGDIQELADSIKEQTLLQAIGINENNELIFGLRRIKAAKLLGWEQIDARVVNVTSLIEGEITENEIRKDFTNDEKVAIGKMIEQQLGERRGNPNFRKDTIPPMLAELETRDIAAQKAGFGSHGTYEKAKLISGKANAEIKNKLDSNEFSINQAYNEIKKEERKQKIELINRNNIISEDSINIYTTEKKYNIIYSDPPWQYWEGGNKNQSLHYRTMSIDEICSLPINRIAGENCILFLWVTYPILEDSFKVIKEWGFSYSTCGFVWIKKNKIKDSYFMGCGSWTRANSELCLIATKGKIQRLDAGVLQIIDEPIMEHSRKPEIVKNKIVQLVGDLSKSNCLQDSHIPQIGITGGINVNNN